jgi:hypothetical protein
MTDGQTPMSAPTGPVATRAFALSNHLRRYTPLYAFGTAWALMLMLFPSLNHDTTTTTPAASGQVTTDATAGGGIATGQAAAELDTSGAAPGIAGPGAAIRGGRATAGAAAGPIGQVAPGTGVTRGGFECKPGVHQIAFSQYAPPCVAKFTGNNGAKTYRGVDDKTIRVIVRATADAGGPNGQTVDQVNKAAGQADRETAFGMLQTYAKYLNQVMELYGRQVVFEKWDGQGNGTDEAQSKGQEAACADAKAIATQKNAFAVLAYTTAFIQSQPFSECAAAEKLFIPLGAAYFPERDYQKWHPYVWDTVMECERISRDVAEYIGKRLAHKNAKWADEADYQAMERRFGTYVPDNDGYQHCVDLTEASLKNNYGVTPAWRVNYQLDVSRFADQAAAAVVQFKSHTVTTLINACDPISTIFLTQAADNQQWAPEWLMIGVAAQDTDGYGRLFTQSKFRHIFGMSQLGNDFRVNDKKGEAYLAWKAAAPGTEPPVANFGLLWYEALDIFTKFQLGGPALTPDSIAAGLRRMPANGVNGGVIGTSSYQNDHTSIDDSREIYWDPNAIGFDGKKGTYVETYGGRRFLTGQWPTEDPKVYPSG